MDEIKKVEIDIHIKANAILVDGKNPKQTFFAQIPLKKKSIEDLKNIIGWVNIIFEKKETIANLFNIIQKDRKFFDISQLATILYLDTDNKLYRTYHNRNSIMTKRKDIEQIII